MPFPDEEQDAPARDLVTPDVTPDVTPGAASEIEVPHTGDLAVDEALSRLAEAAGTPLEDQVNTFDAVHRILQDRLADVEG